MDFERKPEKARRHIGIFQIRNLINEKVFIGGTFNLDNIFHKNIFLLYAQIHPSESLQTDWNEFGVENFRFEILEEIVADANLYFKLNYLF